PVTPRTPAPTRFPYTTLFRSRAIDGQNPELNLEIIQLRNRASVSAHTEKHGLGSLDVASLQAAADAYHRLGLISRPLDMQQLVADRKSTRLNSSHVKSSYAVF